MRKIVFEARRQLVGLLVVKLSSNLCTSEEADRAIASVLSDPERRNDSVLASVREQFLPGGRPPCQLQRTNTSDIVALSPQQLRGDPVIDQLLQRLGQQAPFQYKTLTWYPTQVANAGLFVVFFYFSYGMPSVLSKY